MNLFTKKIEAKLTRGGGHAKIGAICKIFGGPATWILFGSEPGEPDVLWTVADLGIGFIEYGTVLRSELEELRAGPFRLPLERDLYFQHEGKPVEFFTTQEMLSGI